MHIMFRSSHIIELRKKKTFCPLFVFRKLTNRVLNFTPQLFRHYRQITHQYRTLISTAFSGDCASHKTNKLVQFNIVH